MKKNGWGHLRALLCVCVLSLVAGQSSALHAGGGRSPSGYDPKKDPEYNGFKYRPGQGYSLKKWALPAPPSCKIDVKETIKVTGVFDGRGCMYRWRANWNGISYKDLCFAPEEISEKTPPMFKLMPGATLRNVIIECALDGVHTTRDNVIENIVIRDVEEDAITAREDIVIRNSQFWFCNDKCIQMNSADTVKITGNQFYYTRSAILANTGKNVEVKNNFFYETRSAIRSQKSISRVVAENNTHEGGRCHLGAEEGGILEDWGAKSVKGVRDYKCEKDGGRVIRK